MWGCRCRGWPSSGWLSGGWWCWLWRVERVLESGGGRWSGGGRLSGGGRWSGGGRLSGGRWCGLWRVELVLETGCKDTITFQHLHKWKQSLHSIKFLLRTCYIIVL